MIAYAMRHAAHRDAEAVLALARDFATSFVDPAAFGASFAILLAASHACLMVAEEREQVVQRTRAHDGCARSGGSTQKRGTFLAPVLDASCEAQRGDGLPPADMAGSSAGGSHTSLSFPRRLYHFFTIRQRHARAADSDSWQDKRAAMQRRGGMTATSEVGFMVRMKYHLRGS